MCDFGELDTAHLFSLHALFLTAVLCALSLGGMESGVPMRLVCSSIRKVMGGLQACLPACGCGPAASHPGWTAQHQAGSAGAFWS